MRYMTVIGDSTAFGCLASAPSWFSLLHSRLDYVSETSFYTPWTGLVSGALGADAAYYNKITGGGWTFYNAAVGGETTTQLEARFDTDVLGHHIAGTDHTVIIGSSTNDFNSGLGGGASVANTMALVEAMASRAVAAGCTVVLAEVNPWGKTGAAPFDVDAYSHDIADALNAAVVALGAANGWQVLDLYTPVVDANRNSPYWSDASFIHITGVGKMLQAAAIDISDWPISTLAAKDPDEVAGLAGHWQVGRQAVTDLVSGLGAYFTRAGTVLMEKDAAILRVPSGLPAILPVPGTDDYAIQLQDVSVNDYLQSGFADGAALATWTADAGVAAVLGGYSAYNGALEAILTANGTGGAFWRTYTDFAIKRQVSWYARRADGAPVTSDDCQVCAVVGTDTPAASLLTTHVRPLGNGTYRLTGTYTGTAATWASGIYVKPNKQVIVWLPKVEAGFVPTMPIVTTVGRDAAFADVLQVLTSGYASGTIIVVLAAEWQNQPVAIGDNSFLWGVLATAGSANAITAQLANGQFQLAFNGANGAAVYPGAGTLSARSGEFVALALTWRPQGGTGPSICKAATSLAGIGAESVTDAMNGIASNLYIGGTGTQFFREAVVYDEAISDADLLAVMDGLVGSAEEGASFLPASRLQIAGTLASEASMGAVADLMGAVADVLADVKLKTDTIPASPAAAGDAMTLTSDYDHAQDDVLTPLEAVQETADAVKLKSDTIGGAGAIAWDYTLTTDGTTPIADARVWVRTYDPDTGLSGAQVIASGLTDNFGAMIPVPQLDAGTYGFWAKKAGIDFPNPDIETVVAS